MASFILRIGERSYKTDGYGRLRVPYSKLDDFKPRLLPIHSSVEITGIKKFDGIYFYITCTNGNDTTTTEHYSLFIHVGTKCSNRQKGINKIEKYRSLFKPLIESGHLPMPMMFDLSEHDRFKNDYSFSFSISGSHVADIAVKEYLKPLIDIVKSSKRLIKAFLCYASEDKTLVEDFANRLRLLGKQVWFDKWEIRVGDSIIEKINIGLKDMTHLVIFLSHSSINKPCVKKELSTGLFRKLKDNSVQVIPILLDKVEVPPIIADIKYADCSTNKRKGFTEAIEAILN